MKRLEYTDIDTLIDAIQLVKKSKIKEYEHVGMIAIQSLKALELLKKGVCKTKETCPLNRSVEK